MLLGLTMIPPRTIDYLAKKNLSTRHMKPLFEFSVKRVQETPKAMQAITAALGCLSELEGKFLLLKTACTSETWGF